MKAGAVRLATASDDAPSAALLWDLDNVNVRKAELPRLADALAALVGPGAVLIAAGHRTRYRASREMLAAHGIELLSGGRRASGADRQLVARARLLRRKGVRRYVVVSNDGDLARLAQLGDLHVVTLNASQLSRKLLAVGCQVWVLVFDQGGWHAQPAQPDCRTPPPSKPADAPRGAPVRHGSQTVCPDAPADPLVEGSTAAVAARMASGAAAVGQDWIHLEEGAASARR